MRVILATRIFSPEPSAASFMFEALARGFRDAGHEVEVLTTRPGPQRVVDIPGVTVRRARVLRDRSGYVRGYLPYMSFDIPLAFRLLLRPRADIYIVEPPPTTGAVVRVIAWLLGRPYAYDAADVWSDAAKLATSSPLVLSLLRSVELFALRGAAHAFAISAGVEERMRELGVTTPTTVIGFGVDTTAFRYEPPTHGRSPYFLYAGSYSEWHGADILVDAFAEFSQSHPGYRLVFVGNGSARGVIEERVAATRATGVEFLEPVAGSELSSLLAGAVASLATLKPGQGYDYAFTTKVYSSIAAGCPVIFTGVGPTVGFIEQHGVGEAVGYDPVSVSEAMVRAALEPKSSDQREALSIWACSNFTLESIARVVVSESERIVANR